MPHNSQTKKDKHTNQAKEIERLEAKVKRLQLAIAAKDAVLSQFADSDNWADALCMLDASDSDMTVNKVWLYTARDPIHLANQALGEGK